MAITGSVERGMLLTTATGTVSFDGLISYYYGIIAQYNDRPWRELIDGTAVMGLTTTREQLTAFRSHIADNIDLVRGGRVAMLASTDMVYGMFRMWELVRSDLDYEVAVFRDRAKAMEWLSTSGSTKPLV